jgi:hypothetical protein
MSKKAKDLMRAAGYFPVDLFEQLEKRAERNLNTVSREIVHIVAEALRKDAQQQKEAIAQ